MLSVANPIYDIVFKYLVEDERIAKSVKMLIDAGMAAEQVAVNLNMDMETLYRLIES